MHEPVPVLNFGLGPSQLDGQTRALSWKSVGPRRDTVGVRTASISFHQTVAEAHMASYMVKVQLPNNLMQPPPTQRP